MHALSLLCPRRQRHVALRLCLHPRLQLRSRALRQGDAPRLCLQQLLLLRQPRTHRLHLRRVLRLRALLLRLHLLDDALALADHRLQLRALLLVLALQLAHFFLLLSQTLHLVLLLRQQLRQPQHLPHQLLVLQQRRLLLLLRQQRLLQPLALAPQLRHARRRLLLLRLQLRTLPLSRRRRLPQFGARPTQRLSLGPRRCSLSPQPLQLRTHRLGRRALRLQRGVQRAQTLHQRRTVQRLFTQLRNLRTMGLCRLLVLRDGRAKALVVLLQRAAHRAQSALLPLQGVLLLLLPALVLRVRLDHLLLCRDQRVLLLLQRLLQHGHSGLLSRFFLPIV